MSSSTTPLSVLCRLLQRTFANQTRAVSVLSSQTRMSSTSSDKVTLPEGQEDLHVEHDVKQQEFVISLGKDHRALLQYTHTPEGAVDLWHTEVPPVFRGKGVAKLLAQAALDHFSSRKTSMIVSCTYLQQYVQHFPQPDHFKYIISE